MIKVDQFMDIKQLHREGHSIRDVARMTGHSRNTVRKVGEARSVGSPVRVRVGRRDPL